MGGCATKLKVLKGDDDSAPAPAPETVKEVSETKEVVNKEVAKLTTDEEGTKIQGAGNEETVKVEGGDSEKVDDIGNKPRSLSNLFKESGQDEESSGKSETTQTIVVPSEPVQQEQGISLPEAEETATTPSAEVESTMLVVASETVIEEIPVIAADTDVEKDITENEEKRTEEKEVAAKDVK
ncbi:hypothetical protein NE237_030477 [Protea cynaroides]|uniref:Uncharacterized protein n=1 Tax=Protea cynaroides TaxID=273540 RepID=A0A9Q0JX04_9MAGN|nr:hypothetical protein NE237_030477 [Protea cynaroides]